MTKQENKLRVYPDFEITFEGKGTIYSVTKLSLPFVPENKKFLGEYHLALIQLDEGPLTTAILTDLDFDTPPQIGDRVENVTRLLDPRGETGQRVYGPMFRPVIEPSSSAK